MQDSTYILCEMVYRDYGQEIPSYKSQLHPQKKKDRASHLFLCVAAKVKIIKEFFHLLRPHQNVDGKQTEMKDFNQFWKIRKRKKKREKEQLISHVTDTYNLVSILSPNLK